MTGQWENVVLDGSVTPPVPMRLYEGAKAGKVAPIVLYLRGRTFLDLDRGETERPIAKALADTGAIVLEADYAIASQNMFPKAMDCAFQALACLSSHRKQLGSAKSPLFVAGDEAGGNVAAGVALKARDLLPGELKGQMLFSPMIDPKMTSASFREADKVGMREKWSDGWSHYIGSFFEHPYAAPCLCSRLNNLAPALIVTSEDDPLRDEVIGYADRMKGCGVSVRKHIFSADDGWTSVYKEGTGKWLPSLCSEITRFVETLH